MTHKPDGGTAFPFFDGRVMNSPEYGMTLRDFFAAAAVQGLLANPQELARVRTSAFAENLEQTTALAMAAFGIADTLLQERAK